MNKIQRESLLKYIEENTFEETEYLKVSDIGYILTDILQTDTVITGKDVNKILNKEKIQQISDNYLFKYLPTTKFGLFKKIINREEKYGFIKWNYTIIPKILGINYKENINDNIENVRNKIKSYKSILEEDTIDKKILKKQLLELGINKE